jgi:hypothetical protein
MVEAMSNAMPAVGTRVTLALSSGAEAHATVSAVDGRRSTVQLDQGDALLLSPGHPLQVCWGSARGMNRMTANGAPEGDVMRLTPAGDVRREQRREFERMSAYISVQLLGGGPPRPGGGGHPVDGVAADISEGGARLLFVGVVPDIVVGKPVRVKVQLPGGPVLDGAAEVVRMFKLRHHTFEVAVRFVGMPERAADQLRQFLFSRQLEMGVASLN